LSRWYFIDPTCPVEAERKAWVETRFGWLVDQFGLERVRTQPVVLPNREFFPDHYEPTPNAVRALLDRVCVLMGVNSERITLEFHNDRPRELTRFALLDDGQWHGAAGTYRGHDGMKVSLSTSMFEDPHALVATIAHELGHVLLLGDGRILNDVSDHEPLTDLLTVVLGFGLFSANTSVREKHWRGGGWESWSVERLGYLDAPTYGYALALFAWTRGEERPRWAKHLRPDVSSPFKKGLRFLMLTSDSLYKPHGSRE
jgi:hypothetical protein